MTSSGSISDVIGGQETPEDGGNDTGHTGGGLRMSCAAARATGTWDIQGQGDTQGDTRSGGRVILLVMPRSFRVAPGLNPGHTRGHSRSFRVIQRDIPGHTRGIPGHTGYQSGSYQFSPHRDLTMGILEITL